MPEGPSHPKAAGLLAAVSRPAITALYARSGLHRAASATTHAAVERARTKLEAGVPLRIVGIGVAGHNAGCALVEVRPKEGPRLLLNNEEERFNGVKHSAEFPRHSLQALLARLARMGVAGTEIDAWCATWDYPALATILLRTLAEELPQSAVMLRSGAFPAMMNLYHLLEAARAPARIGRVIGASRPVALLAMPHHENHAWFSYCASPFAGSRDPVLVSVLDGAGDTGAVTLYVARPDRLSLWRQQTGIFDSLGLLYSFLSSTQGGWTMLSSEGRYMGAAGYGESDRLRNRYYARLREPVRLLPDGEIRLDRRWANWPRRLFAQPYTPLLESVLGPAMPEARMWNPDAVLNVDDIAHAPATQERVDKAAAVQALFEDVLFHIVGDAIDRTGCDRLVLTGGTALNAIANMKLLEAFDAEYFCRRLGRETRLQLWVPPMPGDAGVTAGAAYAFARRVGAPPGPPLANAFLCGDAPERAEIEGALTGDAEIGWRMLVSPGTRDDITLLAELMAFITAADGVIALYQGAAETGPRALGHRSILANATNPQTRAILNARVKFREAFRPLAPMVTPEAAARWFELSPGAAESDYAAYDFMVLTARARPGTLERLPAVVHVDGTSRLQIVRQQHDQLCFAYLKSLGRRIGVEVAVNTSLNVGGPIVQTPRQALATLRRAGGIDVLFLRAADGVTYAAWHAVDAGAKDSGRRFRAWAEAWEAERCA